VVRIKVGHTNTGSSTIQCGPGVRNIKRIDGAPVIAGDMPLGGIAYLCYVDGDFQLLNPNVATAIENVVENITGCAGTPGARGPTGQTTYGTVQYQGIQQIVAWPSPGTFDWTVPAGVLRVYIRLWGGGGPGVEWSQEGLYIKGGDGGYVEQI